MGDFGAIFWKKAWAIVQGIFQKLDHFKKLLQLESFLKISSNFLHSISISICIRKSNKNWGKFWSHLFGKEHGLWTSWR